MAHAILARAAFSKGVGDVLKERHGVLLQVFDKILVGQGVDTGKEQKVRGFRRGLDLVDLGELEVVEKVHHFPDNLWVVTLVRVVALFRVGIWVEYESPSFAFLDFPSARAPGVCTEFTYLERCVIGGASQGVGKDSKHNLVHLELVRATPDLKVCVDAVMPEPLQRVSVSIFALS